MTSVRGVAGALAVVVAVVLVAAAGGPASASHGYEEAEFIVEPMDDRSPGATNVKYGMIVVGEAGVDLRTLERTRAVYDEGSWVRCEAGDAEVFGIDRGNTHDGYEVDETLQDNVKTFSAGEDVFETEYNGEDDFGPSTHLDDGDALVSVAKCIDNPDEPGWYQMSGSTTGVTEDGERVTYGGESHYFWICDCEDESEARETLGPPPSEPEPTATPVATSSGDDGAAGDDGSDADDPPEADSGTGTDADGAADEGTAETAAPAATDAPTAAATRTATPTPTVDRAWADVRRESPTPGAGDGLGWSAALVALAATALAVRRRRP